MASIAHPGRHIAPLALTKRAEKPAPAAESPASGRDSETDRAAEAASRNEAT
jgi:hypothetical protein